MINLTIKTLDGGNHPFTVEDGTTVQMLKEKIKESLNIDLNNQRLIYGGRVLQDHVNLTILDVDGKVIHLVQRSPPCGDCCRGGPSSGFPVSGLENPQERFESLLYQNRYQINDTDLQLNTVYELLLDIRESFQKLDEILQRHNDPLSTPPTSNSERPGPLEIVRAQNAHDYAQIYAEMEITIQQYEPYRLRYSQLLRNVLHDRNASQVNLLLAYMEEIRIIQHSIGHMYHALSHFSFRLDDIYTPLLVSEPAPNPLRPPSLLQTNGNVAPRPQQFNLGNPSANVDQAPLPDMVDFGSTTILLSSQIPIGNNVSQIGLPTQATEHIWTLDSENVMRRMGNQNQRTDATPVGVSDQFHSSSDEGAGAVASGSNDHENNTSPNAQGDNQVMFEDERHIQELMQNIVSVMRDGIAGSLQATERTEDRFTPRPVVLPNLIYDKFLFCNSRHAHTALQRRRYHQICQHEARQQATAREVEGSLLMLVDHVPGLTVDYAKYIAQLLSLRSFPETYMNAALTLLVRQFYVHEPLLYQGREVPVVKEFHKLHSHYHGFALELMERSNGHVVDFVMNRLTPFLNTLTYVTPLRPDLDLEASLRAYFTENLQSNVEAMSAICTEGMRSILLYFDKHTALFRDVCTIVYRHCQSGIAGFRNAYQHFMRLLIDPMAERVKPLFKILTSAVLDGVVNSLDINFPRIEQFIRARTSPNEERFEMEIIIVADTSNDSSGVRPDCVDGDRVSQHLYADNAAVDFSNTIVISDDEESEPVDVPATLNAETAENIESSLQSTAVNVLATMKAETAENIESSVQTAPTSKDPCPGVSSSSENGAAKAVVAGNSNADAPENNWNQNHTPMAQRAEGSGEPLSDAYLASMPPSKRHCVRRQRPPSNLQEFLTACVRAATNNLRITENDMHSFLSIHMRNLGRRRFATNEDINEAVTAAASAASAAVAAVARRFLNSRRFIDLDRPAQREDPNPSTSSNKDKEN